MKLYLPFQNDSKYAVEDDFLPDDTFFTKASWVTYHPNAMGRIESIWGVNCMEFKPDMWMEDDVFFLQSPFKFVMFQSGARICLGREIAFIQMKYIFVSVIRSFLLRVDPCHNTDSIPSLSATMKNELPVRVERHVLWQALSVQFLNNPHPRKTQAHAIVERKMKKKMFEVDERDGSSGIGEQQKQCVVNGVIVGEDDVSFKGEGMQNKSHADLYNALHL
ncbi:hypothetical protein KI387_010199 [Taxus chinensis]|uniref:Cytochrome P450 n=1 Tax=Taxus chinensis TaxID=29808 RepID=A0AA38KUD3_TAXCH|nr:hypothetical protein KI387_010199 [Taxus chinensis]